jgi:hypothetical protein
MGVLHCCRPPPHVWPPTPTDRLWQRPQLCQSCNAPNMGKASQTVRKEWQESEYLQLNQYYDQGMFGTPKSFSNDDNVFPLVWMYTIKALDGRKKAHCTCDGSPKTGRACVLDETYTNCADQTSSRLFYAIAAAENLLIFGADVSNVFGEAPPPKQGFFIRLDRAFMEWWTQHRKKSPTWSQQRNSSALCHARTSRISTIAGETCRCKTLRTGTDTNCT